MKIELLYFDGCPSWHAAQENLELALAEEKIKSAIKLIKVTTDAQAAREKFAGSPSFRVNGIDLWPEKRENYHLECRLYPVGHLMIGAPTVEMFKEQLCAYKK